MTRFFVCFGLLYVLCIPGRLHAESTVASYALIVGVNEGGSGQRALSFAERDATRMAELLVELGRTPRENIRVLQQPSVAKVESALSALRDELRTRGEQGLRTQLLFYYSGHARSHALSLGKEELSLERLRAALRSLPSTLTVVVLDACQSGAFSGVKGAAPAADFSTRSVHDLPHEGIAVLASSTASELSQESPLLGGSYCTHHLTVALRGASDEDGDGRVALDEAYRYAYQHTLSDTARTRVGAQHATLETELRGRGSVPLTYPRDADVLLLLPPGLAGRVLVQRAPRGVVMGELVKAAGSELRMALPHGERNHARLLTRESALLRAPVRIAPDARSLGLDTLLKLSQRLDGEVMETLIYRFVDELGQKEIAEVMSVSAKTVQNRLQRVTECLAQLHEEDAS